MGGDKCRKIRSTFWREEKKENKKQERKRVGSPQNSMCLLKERRADEVQAQRLSLFSPLSSFLSLSHLPPPTRRLFRDEGTQWD